MQPSEATFTDHDLLIELKTTVGFIRTDIRDLKENLSARVTSLEVDKIGRQEAIKLQTDALTIHTDHESRIRTLEKGLEVLITSTSVFQTRVLTWGAAAVVVLGIVEVAVQIYFK